MKLTIPLALPIPLPLTLPLQHEHEALHERLRLATQAGARIEEEVMYPAAVLVGQWVRQRLGQHAPVAA